MSDSNIAAVLGRVPSGLFVLTACHNQDESGMLASWVMQAGFEPPMISVALRQGRFMTEWLSAGAPFVLNLLEHKQKNYLSHFGKGFAPGEPAFSGLKLTRSSSNVPMLADALGHLECQPKQHVESGDHRIFVAEVTHGHLAGEGEPYVHIRKNGLRY
jgi:flavin reductase (DIM6/NTAB) family NADH-FMN oxidoreductase RutF